MTKIFFTCASLQRGGAERVLSVLSPELADYYCEIQYVLWYEAPICYEIDKRVKIVSIEKESGSSKMLKKMTWFRSYINDQKPNLILSFSAPFNMLTLSSLLFTNNRVIACERVDPRSFRWGKHLEILRNILYQTAFGILAQTEISKEYFKGRLYRKTDVIYNPITMAPTEVGSALLVPKKNVIVTAARLAKQKRQDLLIEVFSRFKMKYPEYHLVIYGDGDELATLKLCAKNFNVDDSVEFPGGVKDLWERIKPAKMFIMTSLFEGMSNSMIEAMCLGLPTISTKVSGATDLISHEKNGILIDIDDTDALYYYMCKLATDEAYAKSIGNEATKVYELLEAKSIAKKWINYIDTKVEE